MIVKHELEAYHFGNILFHTLCQVVASCDPLSCHLWWTRCRKVNSCGFSPGSEGRRSPCHHRGRLPRLNHPPWARGTGESPQDPSLVARERPRWGGCRARLVQRCSSPPLRAPACAVKWHPERHLTVALLGNLSISPMATSGPRSGVRCSRAGPPGRLQLLRQNAQDASRSLKSHTAWPSALTRWLRVLPPGYYVAVWDQPAGVLQPGPGFCCSHKPSLGLLSAPVPGTPSLYSTNCKAARCSATGSCAARGQQCDTDADHWRRAAGTGTKTTILP